VTDGITEAQDPAGDLYGRKKVLAVVASNGGSPVSLCEGLRDSVRAFEAGVDPTDDLTVMALRYLGPRASKRS